VGPENLCGTDFPVGPLMDSSAEGGMSALEADMFDAPEDDIDAGGSSIPPTGRLRSRLVHSLDGPHERTDLRDCQRVASVTMLRGVASKRSVT